MKLRTLALLLPFMSGLVLASERPLIPDKSEIGFTVTQMGVGVSGSFRRFSAKIDLDPAKTEKGSAEIEVDIASIATGEPDADTEALTRPWLDAAGFPKATFKSSALRELGGGRYEVKGLLSLKGKPRELTVPFTFRQQADGSTVASGEFALRRTDFDIGGGEWNEDDLVANEVPVRFRFTLGAPR
ncbi:MAG: YceI family protein [Nevskiales bacterium]